MLLRSWGKVGTEDGNATPHGCDTLLGLIGNPICLFAPAQVTLGPHNRSFSIPALRACKLVAQIRSLLLPDLNAPPFGAIVSTYKSTANPRILAKLGNEDNGETVVRRFFRRTLGAGIIPRPSTGIEERN